MKHLNRERRTPMLQFVGDVWSVTKLMNRQISGSIGTGNRLDVLWQSFGEDRLIYGRNWPVCERAGDYYVEGINIVKAYFQEKGEAAYQKYFWQNAQAVYKWPAR